MNKLTPLYALFMLAGCAATSSSPYTQAHDSAPENPEQINIAAIPNAIPRYEPRTRAGNPESYNILGEEYTVLSSSKNHVERGIASWYGTKFHGHKTSNGETYNMYAMTAAHKTLPIPTYLQVTNMENHRSVVVRVNDRGPFHKNRIIDLSYAAAVKLGIEKSGTGFVEIRSVEPSYKAGLPAPVDPNQEIYLQLGAFSNQDNALNLYDKLIDNELPSPRILTEKQSRSPIYKVQVGPILSVASADKINAMLTKIGISNARIVTEHRRE